ncbi:MAG: hypothetical protein FHP92_01100 [Denitromonas halophila]|uniref:Uncharacterized protein n=2 Tax=Denitromonas TaxID=139331 RepID=A0A557SKV4_9RHOO|nr:hypothetical protein FHP90_05470 [Denitromonas ohlonensis]TVO78066.1 hypothetical protein FHP89_06190 [Denitromonas ohlonensis]TVT78482.1 MAG: hypothetical protein FHP92_01100 [Denitromonas halophila]
MLASIFSSSSSVVPTGAAAEASAAETAGAGAGAGVLAAGALAGGSGGEGRVSTRLVAQPTSDRLIRAIKARGRARGCMACGLVQVGMAGV